MRRIVPQLVNELHSVAIPLVLVLDDYHTISHQSIHDSVEYLIDHVPCPVKIVLSTRADPPFPLGRLRASGEMVELRAAQLGLNEEESADLFRSRFDLDLDPTSVELLCRRTEGWPAGLQLAGLAMKEADDHDRFVKRFAGNDRNVADYLTGEVLDRLPPEKARFLTHTSILDRLNGPLCEAVAQVAGSAELLEDLEHDNLFLVPLDHHREWYRYHNLFGEWLRHELQRTEPELIGALHSRASRWLESQGYLQAAVSHAIASGELDRAGVLFDQYLAESGEVNWPQAFRWVGQMPDSVKERHPMVAIAQVRLAFAQGDFMGGRRWLPIAEKALIESGLDSRRTVETTVDLFTAFGELVEGDMDRSRILFEKIAEVERPRMSPHFAMAIGYAGTATFWTEGPLNAIPPLQEGVLAQERTSMRDTGATALLAGAYAEIGDWRAAETTARQALAISRPYDGFAYPFQMPAHFALGQVLVARGNQEGGIEELETGLEEARAWVEPIFVAYGCLLLADALDDYFEKRALVREARQLIEDGRGRGRIQDLVAMAERKLSLRQPKQRTSGTVHVASLTDRERDVLRWLRSELSLAEVAREMYVSYNTVKGHTKSIYRKLGVTSRAAAVQTGDELDLI
jgi:LuxR family maltose regulon positive regulatory protein